MESKQIKLSILIATMPSREKQFYALLDCINYQLAYLQDVQVISDNSMSYNIGVKRNSLLARAKGEYIVFIDDDDTIAPNYISLILAACKSGADCIGINGTITTNGQNEKKWFISKDYKRWYEANGIYYRTPNHISPVRRELALQVGFPEISFGEDAIYSEKLLPLLKTEQLVQRDTVIGVQYPSIYHYKYVTNK